MCVHVCLTLQDLGKLVEDIDLSLICLYCRKDFGVPLVTCKTCPCAFHQYCYESRVNDKVCVPNPLL